MHHFCRFVTSDKWMALRVSVYVGLLYQHLVKENQLNDDATLPPVFPLVLYNRDNPGHYAQDLQSLIALPPHSPLRQWQPQSRYYLLDKSQYSDGKAGSITGTLFRIDNTKNINLLRENLKILEQQIPATKAGRRRALVAWICYVIAPHKGLQLDKGDTKNLTEVNEMLSTRLKQWEQEIREKSELTGEAKTLKKTLKKMLALKFGPLPDWAEQQISQADSARLDQWIGNLLDADNLEGIFK